MASLEVNGLSLLISRILDLIYGLKLTVSKKEQWQAIVRSMSRLLAGHCLDTRVHTAYVSIKQVFKAHVNYKTVNT